MELRATAEQGEERHTDSKRLTCECCAIAKARCVHDDGDADCQRCTKRGEVCVWTRKKRRVASGSSGPVSSLLPCCHTRIRIRGFRHRLSCAMRKGITPRQALHMRGAATLAACGPGTASRAAKTAVEILGREKKHKASAGAGGIPADGPSRSVDIESKEPLASELAPLLAQLQAAVRTAVSDEGAVLSEPLLLLSTPGCPAETFHRDLVPTAELGDPGSSRFCGSVLLALEGGTFLDWFPGSHCVSQPIKPIKPERLEIKPGTALLQHGACVHAEARCEGGPSVRIQCCVRGSKSLPMEGLDIKPEPDFHSKGVVWRAALGFDEPPAAAAAGGGT